MELNMTPNDYERIVSALQQDKDVQRDLKYKVMKEILSNKKMQEVLKKLGDD